MGFLFGLVVGQNRPLAEYSAIEGNHIQTAMKVIKSMNRNNKSAFSDHGDYVFTLKSNDDGFIFVCLASRDVDLQAQNIFLDKMEEKWNEIVKPNLVDFQPYSQNLLFSNVISDLIANANADILSRNVPLPIDRNMTNIHLTLVSGDELSITKKKTTEKISKRTIILGLKRFKNRIISNRGQWFTTLMILLIVLIAVFLLFSTLNS